METFFLSAFSSIERLQVGLDEGMKEYRVNDMAEMFFVIFFMNIYRSATSAT